MALLGIYFETAHNDSSFLNWLRTTESDVESGSTTIRNLGLVIGALFALYIAAWRSIVAGRQAETARQNLLNERYQKGAEMLGSKVLSVRLGGIYALQELAKENPSQYYVLVMRLLCAFIRHPTEDKSVETKEYWDDSGDVHYSPFRVDVQSILCMFRYRDQKKVDLEEKNEFEIDLSGSDLRGAVLTGLNLAGSNLSSTRLNGAYLVCANLSNANLTSAVLHNAELQGSDMSGATLIATNVSEAVFYGTSASNPPKDIPVRGLTQDALNYAMYEPLKSPILHRVLDADTGHPLTWKGRIRYP